jgi:hypothetical protein
LGGLTDSVGNLNVELQQRGEGSSHHEAHVLYTDKGDEHADTGSARHEDGLREGSQDDGSQARQADGEEDQPFQEGAGQGFLEGDLCAQAAGEEARVCALGPLVGNTYGRPRGSLGNAHIIDQEANSVSGRGKSRHSAFERGLQVGQAHCPCAGRLTDVVRVQW